MPITDLVLPLLIFVAAVLYASVGHAGASGYLAAMALVGIAPSVMRPSALVLNVLVATLASSRFARVKGFRLADALPFLAGSIPASFVGGMLDVPGGVYRPLVAVVLLAAAVRLVLPVRVASDESATRIPLFPALGTGVMIGLLAGLTGTGGGIFLSPVVLFAGWAGARIAAGLSAVFILGNSLAGISANPAGLQSIPSAFPLWALAAVSGGVIGASFGARRLPTRTMQRLLAVVLVVAVVKLLGT